MSDITAAPIPFRIGDVEYRMSPLRDVDLSELDNWLRQHYIRTGKDSLIGATAEERQESLAIIYREAATLTFLSPMGARLLASVDGIARLVWQSAKNNHKDLTPEAVRKNIYSKDAIDEAMRIFDELNMQPAAKVAQKSKKGVPRQARHTPRTTSTGN